MTTKRKDIDDFQVRFMYEIEGMTYQEIADYYSANISTIYYRLHPEKQKERVRKYCSEHLEKKKECSRKYYNDHSDQVLERVRRYQQEHPEQERERRRKRYREHTKEEREYNIRWWQTPNGKALTIRHNAKRRKLGFIPLNKPFEGSEGHHIDEEHVIHMPKETHQSIWHNLKTGQGIEEINTMAFHYISEDMLDKLVRGVM